MSIDTGQNLVFNANFPTPGVDQPSQQFRDNFQIIKTAIENLQSVSSDSGSILSLTSTLSSVGALTFDIAYNNNAFILPINDPSVGSPVAGMIRFSTTTSCLEFFDGTAWRATIFKDSTGAVTLTTLTVTNRLTLGYTPTQPTDATTKSYVDAQIATINSAVSSSNYASNAAVNAVQADLNAEKINRASGDTTLQNEITAINATLTNSGSQANAITSQLTTLTNGLAAEANTRAAADTAQQTSINNLNGQVNTALSIANDTSTELTQEITDRENADQYLYNVINAGVTPANITNAIAAESAARVQGDSDNSNAITNLTNNLAAEQARAEGVETSLSNELSNVVLITGSTMTGDLTMQDANIVVDSGSLLLTNSLFNFEGGVSVQPMIISDTFVYFENTVVNLEQSSSLLLTNSALYLPGSNLTLDSGQYFYLNSIPNTVGGGDGSFLTYDQNNFMYARMVNTLTGIVSNSIVANGVANTNAMYEFSTLRIATTNDPANGQNGDSIAIEPACDLWLNPGWSGVETAETEFTSHFVPRVPAISNASIYVGNAVYNTVRIERATGNITTAGCIIINGNAGNTQAPVLFTPDSSGVDPLSNGAITNASIAPPPLLANSHMQVAGVDGYNTRMELVSYGAGTKYAGRASGGTNAAPTATPAGTILVSIGGFGYDGTQWPSSLSSGSINIIANSAWTTTNYETTLNVGLTPRGSTVSNVVVTVSGTGDIAATGVIRPGVFTSSTIPSAASAGAGARAFVTDSSSAASGAFGSAYSGGGTHSVPVWSDGSFWYIG